MNHKSFADILNFSWAAQIDSDDPPMLLLYKKLRRPKPCLKKLDKDFYSDIQKRVLAANEELAHIQSRCANAPGDPILMENEKLCLLHYNEFSLAEESWSRQKSRIRWLNLGDNNTKFFH